MTRYGPVVDLRTWLLDDHADLRGKLHGSVIRLVPRDDWRVQADGGGSGIAWILLHLTRHHDLALTTAIGDHEPLFEQRRAALGLADAGPAVGMSEQEDPATTAALDLEALVRYADAVFDESHEWLDHLSVTALDSVPDTSRRLDQRAGLPADGLDWLHRMWSGRTVAWLVQWPVLGHGHAHVGEAISVRNRLGHSPF